MERIQVGAPLTAAPYLSEVLVELAPGSSSLTICCPCCRPDPHRLCWESQDSHLLRTHSCPQLASEQTTEPAEAACPASLPGPASTRQADWPALVWEEEEAPSCPSTAGSAGPSSWGAEGPWGLEQSRHGSLGGLAPVVTRTRQMGYGGVAKSS